MKIAVVLAASVLSFSAFDAGAAAPVDVESITVSYADLNIDHKPGIIALYQRIAVAAQRLCKPVNGETLVAKLAYDTCRTQAVTTAVARIDRPMLSDYVAQQLGQPVGGAFGRVAVR